MKFKVGDTISWRGCWGSEKEKPTQLQCMQRTQREHEKYGTEVAEVEWNEATGRWTFPFIADLSNGSWAYSYQLAPNNLAWEKPPEWYGNRRI